MANTKESKTFKKPRTLKKIAVITAVTVIGIIAIILALIAIETLNNQFKSSKVKSKIRVERQIAEKSFQIKLDQKIADLQKQGVIDSNITETKADTCYIDHNDSGWMIQEWYQNCNIKYIGVFSAEYTPNEAFSKLSQVQKNLIVERCASLEDYSSGFSLLYRPPNAPEQTFDCKAPQVEEQTFDSSEQRRKSTQYYTYLNRNRIDNSKSQIWIVYELPYYHETLGCNHIGLSCDPPRSKPTHPPL